MLASRRGWLAALLVGTLVAWYAVALGAFSVQDPWPTSGPGRFVPDDATRTVGVTLRQGSTSTAGMVEASRVSGRHLAVAMSPSAFTALDLPVATIEDSFWWREAVIPNGEDLPARYRIRSVDAAGVWLHAQDWGDLGFSLEHFLELPADVTPGRTWTNTGRTVARPADQPATYRSTSTASIPADPARAAQGCLDVGSSAELSGPRRRTQWHETNL